MKNILALVILSMLNFLFSFSVFAEGSCPPGYYPIGGQGVSGCAPMGTTGGASPQASGEWKTKWGALARSEDGSVLGVAAKESSKYSARSTALKFCKNAGGQGCKVTLVFKNACVAQASSDERNISIAYTESTKNSAEKGALEKCGSSDCKITYSECSQAEFRSYR
ncbi:hypothetical protein GGR70_004085 [Xanthomonas campestris]|uniref:DUF4189 domain-containing protein n=1 Tax=Xanthomonas campestris TaxID=339 RepID=UPI001CBB9B15|nr:DUF4189 domain-containing protein [Xanthomonas campestris]MCS3849000.1 hypothetical protein [Xanthomonas campestris]MEA9730599.1 DUF4189 domain-containing protein [Xanthomonas campestris]UAU33220.1 DUF4189 domain-containing protein [Xanthomonas campestris pv. incanae]WDJ92494.1 DUF4189 domain-containing protein [Xanthomonas campestris pv. incanae]